MEDAILENSKGATYLSFILDVEIVIKKEGRAKVAETVVKSKNTRESKEESGDKERGKSSEMSKNQGVYLVAGNQTNLRDIGNQQKNYECLVGEKSTVVNQNNPPSPEQKMKNVGENKKSDDNKKQKHKIFHSSETSPSETSDERHHKRKRMHKSGNSARIFKGKVEPVDFLECNRIFTCNYFQLVRHNSDSALYCNQLGTYKKGFQQEHIDILEEQFQNVRSVSDILSLLKHNSFCDENIHKKDCPTVNDLGKVCQNSCGDYNVAKTHESSEKDFGKLYYIKNTLMDKVNTMDIKLLYSYLKRKFLREQTIKDNKDQLVICNSKVSFPHNLLPIHQGLLTLKDKVESLPNIKIEFKSNSENSRIEPKDQVLTDCLISAINTDKSERDLSKDLSNVKPCTSNDSNIEKVCPAEEVVKFQEIKMSYSKMNAVAFLKRIKSMKKSKFFISNKFKSNEKANFQKNLN